MKPKMKMSSLNNPWRKEFHTLEGKGAREKFTDVLTGDLKVRYQDTVECLQNTKTHEGEYSFYCLHLGD